MKALQKKLEKNLRDDGASLVGFADLRDLPADVRRSFPVGISIAVALDPEIISKITWGPTKEYFQEYSGNMPSTFSTKKASAVSHCRRRRRTSTGRPSGRPFHTRRWPRRRGSAGSGKTPFSLPRPSVRH
jgi:hypothetical protein